jgi:hypothetical protein
MGELRKNQVHGKHTPTIHPRLAAGSNKCMKNDFADVTPTLILIGVHFAASKSYFPS